MPINNYQFEDPILTCKRGHVIPRNEIFVSSASKTSSTCPLSVFVKSVDRLKKPKSHEGMRFEWMLLFIVLAMGAAGYFCIDAAYKLGQLNCSAGAQSQVETGRTLR